MGKLGRSISMFRFSSCIVVLVKNSIVAVVVVVSRWVSHGILQGYAVNALQRGVS